MNNADWLPPSSILLSFFFCSFAQIQAQICNILTCDNQHQYYLGRKLLAVRFCTLPLSVGSLGELDPLERPADDPLEPFDLAGDCLRLGERREDSGTGGGLMTISMEEACSGEAGREALAEFDKLGAAKGGTS